MLKSNDGDIPCVGIIQFNVFIHKILNDGSVDPEILNCSGEFKALQASDISEIQVTGINKIDCIKKIVDLLAEVEKHGREKLNNGRTDGN